MAERLIAPLLIAAALAPWPVLTSRPDPICPTEPVPLDRLNLVIDAATPTTGAVGIPTGTRPATWREARALRDVMDAFVACGDAGEPLRVLGLYTDRYLGELYYRQGLVTATQYSSLARPDPADADERTRLLDVVQVAVLADGRVAGVVTIRYAVIPTPKRFIVTIAPVDGSWRIDDILGELTFALP